MTATDTLRVGVIGAGWVATARHLPSLRRIQGVEVVAVADRHLERAQAAIGRSNAAACTTLNEVLRRGIDAVAIATPPWSHAELAVAALEAGCHVFCEKPMALNTGDARAMVEAATRNDRNLCVSHNFLFSRSVRRADAILGSVPPTFVKGLQMSSSTRRLPTWVDQLPGGLLVDESPHMLYVLTHFLGAPLTLQYARAARPQTGHRTTAVELMLEGSRGAGSITMCFDTPVSEWHVGLVSDRRVLALDLFRDIVTSIGPDGEHKAPDIAKTSLKAISDQVIGFATTGVRLATKRQFWGHDELIRRFVEACRARARAPVNPEDALSIVRLTDDILQALGIGP